MKLLKIILALIACYILIVARWGYEYGRNDQMQALSYAKMLNDDSLYPKDAYLRGIHEHVPNERYVFSKLMSFFGNNMETASLVLHLVVSICLFFILFRVANEYISTHYWIWIYLLVLFIPLYTVFLGGNELYHNTLFVSIVVKTFALWGIFHFLRNRFLLAFVIFGLATLLQPVVGLQLFVTCFAVLCLLKWLDERDISMQDVGLSFVAWMVTGGVWIFYLKSFFEGGDVSNATFFNILFEFRSPYHYMPSGFDKKSWFILIPLMIFGTRYFYKRSRKLFFFFAVSWVLLAGYTVCVELFRSVNVASIQWFKITIWLEAFGLIALMAWLEKNLPFLKKQILLKLSWPTLIVGASIVLGAMVVKPDLFFWNVPRDYRQVESKGDAVLVAQQVKLLTEQDALILHPIAFTELKIYGERSAYLDHRILVHRKTAMVDWYNKIKAVYGISLETARAKVPELVKADEVYRSHSVQWYQRLHDEAGVTHVITFSDTDLALRKLYSNETYSLYQIRHSN